MVKKIDSILERVKEPESGLSISDLGFVERIRFSANKNRFYVFTKALHQTHGCCTLLSLVQQTDVLSDLRREFEKEFPENWVEIVNV